MQYDIMIWNAAPVTGSCRLNYRNCRRRDFEGGVDAMRVMVIIVEVSIIEPGTAYIQAHVQMSCHLQRQSFLNPLFF
jgi:hypothetical protein